MIFISDNHSNGGGIIAEVFEKVEKEVNARKISRILIKCLIGLIDKPA